LSEIPPEVRTARNLKMISVARSLVSPRLDSSDAKPRISEDFKDSLEKAGISKTWQTLDHESLEAAINSNSMANKFRSKAKKDKKEYRLEDDAVICEEIELSAEEKRRQQKRQAKAGKK
jgi:glucan phosphoethanolaminetransferase (alkaline phosphatase superfamily)